MELINDSLTNYLTSSMGIRHEWFQTDQYITVTIFAKGITEDRIQVIRVNHSLLNQVNLI